MAARRTPTAGSEMLGRVAIRANSIGAADGSPVADRRSWDASPATVARRRLLCIYQHAPTPGAPGIYRHRLYLSELVRRGWDVDLIATPINYMRGTVPEAYVGRPYVRELIDGVVHHWVWASSGVHRSRRRRAMNYVTFATAAAAARRDAPAARRHLGVVAAAPGRERRRALARRYRRPWMLEVRDLWPESAVSVGWLREDTLLYGALDRVAHHSAQAAAAVLVPTPGLAEPVQRHGARAVAWCRAPCLTRSAHRRCARG